MPTMHVTLRGLRGNALRLLFLIAFFCAAAQTAGAASNCTMGLPDRTAAAPPTLDGKLTSAGEWNDAALLTSGDPCLALLQDRPGGVVQSRTVKVYSKRYSRGGQTVIGFLFEIPDETTAATCGAGMNELCGLGESIVLQFDSNRSRGAQLAGSGAANALANDYQIVLSHKWKTTAGSDLITDLVANVFESQASIDCGTPVWAAAAGEAFNPAWMAAQKVVSSGTGYSVEVEIPLSFLGTPTNDLGFAFAVTNNLGSDSVGVMNCSGDICDGYGVAFPNSMAMELSNAANPYNVCHGNWAVPDEWGTLSFGLAAGDVSVSRSPDYWSNDGLLVFQCNDNATAYSYYSSQPCRARLVAKVKNTGPAQTRNLLFLWSPVGAGTPADYTRVELVENVPIPAGTMAAPSFTNVSTAEWTGVPKNQLAHPCVRVYVLPGSYVPAFPRTSVLAVDAADDVVAMTAAYGLSNGQWTQKNIARIEGTNVCPDAACRITMRERAPGEAGAEMASASTGAGDAWGGSRLAPAQPPLPVLHLRPGEAEPAPAPQGGTERPPVVARPGGNILMPSDEFKRFSRDNVMVQVRAFGYGRRPSGPSAYNFLENMGGVIQLVPVELLQRLETVPFAFNVTNDQRDKTIFLIVDVFAPSGVAGVQVALDTSKRDYAPRENRVMRGLVTLTGRPAEPPGDFKRWGLSLHAGASIPHGNFANIFNPGPNVGVDLEYRFNRRFSLEAIYTFNHFRGETFTFNGQSFTLDGTNIHNLSLNGKVYGGTSPVRPFFNFGGGVYVFDSVTARGGVNVGGGLQFDLTPNVALDSMYNFHNVFGSGSSLRYSTVQGGVRFRF